MFMSSLMLLCSYWKEILVPNELENIFTPDQNFCLPLYQQRWFSMDDLQFALILTLISFILEKKSGCLLMFSFISWFQVCYVVY